MIQVQYCSISISGPSGSILTHLVELRKRTLRLESVWGYTSVPAFAPNPPETLADGPEQQEHPTLKRKCQISTFFHHYQYIYIRFQWAPIPTFASPSTLGARIPAEG